MNRQLFVAVALAILVPRQCKAQSDTGSLDVGKFVEELRSLVLKEYPEASITEKDSNIHFEFNVRKYMIHEPFLTGEWQDAHEEVGPQRSGIFCDMKFCRGDYIRGQAEVPQDFDKRYFITRVMAPYSKKLDHHLYVHFKYPRDVKPEFLKEVQTLIDRFDQYCLGTVHK